MAIPPIQSQLLITASTMMAAAGDIVELLRAGLQTAVTYISTAFTELCESTKREH